jgi:hypothetical protein
MCFSSLDGPYPVTCRFCRPCHRFDHVCVLQFERPLHVAFALQVSEIVDQINFLWQYV